MINKPKGTYDLFKDEGRSYKYIESVINELMDLYNYEFIKTPLFESSNLFHRSVGETSDIVTKETYDFVDRGNRNLTLRPEGTAGVVRSFIENKMYADNSLKKLWYIGPMYRYERPQSGRYREFIQFGCEVLSSGDPMIDAEIISIPVSLFEALGLKGVKVKVNSLGDNISREKYKEALVKYFEPHIDELCEDCKARFKKNPLRILDCKVDKDLDVLKNAPKILDYLNEESNNHFNKVLEYLNNLNINYEVDDRIIRGLDYYTHTVFEIEADVEGFGAQNVMCAGGRYDNLVKSLDGPEVKAVGFAVGIERLMKALEYEQVDTNNKRALDVFVVPVSINEKALALEICQALRLVGISSDIDYLNKNLKGNLKQAESFNAKYAFIIGEEEAKTKKITIRNLKTREEEKVDFKNMIEYMYNNLEDYSSDECCGKGDCHCKKDNEKDN